MVGWHSLAGQSSSPSKKIAARLDYDQDGTSQEEEEEESQVKIVVIDVSRISIGGGGC